MEVDHIYICTEKNAPAGDLLKEFGFTEGSPNIHQGQGTANRRFFFHNIMLELLWINDSDEAQSDRTKPMRLYERCMWRSDFISPFGIGFRPENDMDECVPFPAWDYHPQYLPETMKIQVAGDTPLSEPMYFYMAFAGRQSENEGVKKEPLEHIIPLKKVTEIKLFINQKRALSEAACIINNLKNISIESGKENLLELEFDCGKENKIKDFRPAMPLVFKW